MTTLRIAALLLAVASTRADAQVNAGKRKAEPSLPFTITRVAAFNLPWRVAFLPDSRMLVTEKVGPVWLVTERGEKSPIANVPAVLHQGQGGMLGVFLSPHYATDHNVYLTYAEPGDGGSSLALARARLKLGAGTASLDGLQVLWRQMPKGRGGQFGAQIAFSPNGRYLFLTVGDRQRMTPAQDPNQALGKILRLTLDGKPAPGNPKAGTIGAASVPLIDPPHDTEMAKSAPVIRTYTFPEPNLARTLNRITFDGKGGATPAERWDIGHRVRDVEVGPDGALWLLEDANPGGLFRLTPK
jgi:glucose/arabinose dehydrogenase